MLIEDRIILEAASIIVEGTRWKWASFLRDIASGIITFSDIIKNRAKGYSKEFFYQFKRDFLSFMKHEEGRGYVTIRGDRNNRFIYPIEDVLAGKFPSRESDFGVILPGYFRLYVGEVLYGD